MPLFCTRARRRQNRTVSPLKGPPITAGAFGLLTAPLVRACDRTGIEAAIGVASKKAKDHSMSTPSTSNRLPSHRIYAVSQRGEGKKAEWREIGAAWPHKDGKGFNLKLNMLPLNGADVVIREAGEENESKEGGAQ